MELPAVEGTTLPPAHRGGAMALTASDGTGLRLASVTGRAVVEGPLALTELRMVFDNPEDRTLEGRFKMTLPARATVSRLAMKVGDTWQEGEVVERKKARAAYEDFLHRKQDPALLEQTAGNEVSARVFPIPARGRKEIIVSYSEELVGDAPYAMPIGDLPRLDELDVQLTEGGRAATLRKRDFTPSGDFGLPRGALGVAARAGDLAVIPVRAVSRPEADPLDGALVLVDTSASRALGFDAELELVRELVSRMGNARVVVAAFDQTTDVVFDGLASRFGASSLAGLRERGALGASDLGAALSFARARAQSSGLHRVIVVGDGVATAGATTPDELNALTTALGPAGVRRIDAVAVGGIRDEKALARLVTAGLANAGVVTDAKAGPDEIAKRLGERALSGVAVEIPGARWSWPRTLEGVQSGDEVLVYAELPAGTPARAIVGGVEQSAPRVVEVAEPLLDRAWAKAKIDALVESQNDENRKDVAAEVTALSTRHRVLSPFTSLLVLETDRDYQRFGIERTALSRIVTVSDGRVAVVDRTLPAPPPPVAPPAAPTQNDKSKRFGVAGPSDNADPHLARQAALREAAEFGMIGMLNAGAGGDPTSARGNMWGDDVGDSFGAGGLGLSGIGEGGGGRGDGVGLGSIGAIGHGAGAAPAQGIGSGNGRLGGSHRAAEAPAPRREIARPPADKATRTEPYTGTMRSVMEAIASHREREAVTVATAWHDREPGDVMALIALGEALEAAGDLPRAARAYGSIIDLFPARADLRRFAGERLERIATAGALALAVDTYAKAYADRPDHASSAHLYAMSLAKQGSYERAAGILDEALARNYPRTPAADRILREDYGLVGAAWTAREPGRRTDIDQRLAKAGVVHEDGASLRFVLTWETDANDVDFHIDDASGDHAYHAHRQLGSGGELYADVTSGYGPECFTVRKPRGARSPSYALRAHYYSRGPMGYGMGKVEIVEHDGHGGLKFEQRPFVVMTDRAFVDLGTAR
jgi:tetratricopeptide (TPR) repeat protein